MYHNKSHLFDSELKTKIDVNTFESRNEKKIENFSLANIQLKRILLLSESVSANWEQ